MVIITPATNLLQLSMRLVFCAEAESLAAKQESVVMEVLYAGDVQGAN